MSYKEIAGIVLLGSSMGIGTLVFYKIPILVTLPKFSIKKKKKSYFSKFNKKIKKINPFRKFHYEIVLQKVLTKLRILSLKTDNKLLSWLRDLKETNKKRRTRENDNYWEKVKRATKK